MASARQWPDLIGDPGFVEYINQARAFDPTGFDRAFFGPEADFFKEVIVEAYHDDTQRLPDPKQ